MSSSTSSPVSESGATSSVTESVAPSSPVTKSAGTLENDADCTDQAKRQRIGGADPKHRRLRSTATERWATVQQLYGSVENFMAEVTLGGLQAVMCEIEELEEESIGEGKGKDKGDDKDKDKTNIGGADPKHDKEGDKA